VRWASAYLRKAATSRLRSPARVASTTWLGRAEAVCGPACGDAGASRCGGHGRGRARPHRLRPGGEHRRRFRSADAATNMADSYAPGSAATSSASPCPTARRSRPLAFRPVSWRLLAVPAGLPSWSPHRARCRPGGRSARSCRRRQRRCRGRLSATPPSVGSLGSASHRASGAGSSPGRVPGSRDPTEAPGKGGCARARAWRSQPRWRRRSRAVSHDTTVGRAPTRPARSSAPSLP
jgi:hypothetical protein